MKTTLSVLSILFLFSLSGCGLFNRATETPELTLPPELTFEPVPPTSIPPTKTPVPLPTPTPYVPVEVKVIFDGLRLRSGPGYQFETLELYSVDTQVKVLGIVPGYIWVHTQTPDGQTGWMLRQGLELPLSIYDLPVIEPEGVITLRGHVYTTNGNPASDMVVMANPLGDETTKYQDVGNSDVLGRWFIYFPNTYKGNWSVVVNGYGCESNAVNSVCSLLGAFPPPQTINLSEIGDSWMDFQLVPYSN